VSDLNGKTAAGDDSDGADTEHSTRVVVLLNKNLDPGVALNAIAHLGMSIANVVGELGRARLKFLDYIDKDGHVHPGISARSLIVLRGKPGELRKLRQEAIASRILNVNFTNTMTGGTYKDQLERTSATPEAELEYFGVAVFGRAEEIAGLTRRYSLWR
jgi:hypothetical protein